jgi:hypothetical protein
MVLNRLNSWLCSLFRSTIQEAAQTHSAELKKLSTLLLEMNQQIASLSKDVADIKEKSRQPEVFFASKNQNVSPRQFWH